MGRPVKYHAKGRKVLSGEFVCRINGSKRKAKRTADRLNTLHQAKMNGRYVSRVHTRGKATEC